MDFSILISIASKAIPESKLKRFLARKFEKQVFQARKHMKNPTTFTFCSNKRMDFTLSKLSECINQKLEGDTIECGVYRGGSSYQIAKQLKKLDSEKKLYALDTFEGHPYDDYSDMPKDLFDKLYKKEKPRTYKGKLDDVNLDEIKKFFLKEKLENTVFMKGLFENSFKTLTDKKFCFAHVDADTYLSVHQCLEFLKRRMIKGGIIIIDDYNVPGLAGCNEAVNIVLGKSSVIPLEPFGAYWVKT